MKREGAVSHDPSVTAPESAEMIYDFLYVDRARVSLLYAQLFPEGSIQSVKTTQQTGFYDDNKLGGNLQFVNVETKSSESGSEGIERMYDASAAIPLEVLSRLKSRSLLTYALGEAKLGSIVMESDCHLRIMDFASMDRLWEPGLKFFLASQPEQSPEMLQDALSILKAMPQVIHAHFLTSHFLWSSLELSGLTIPTTDITLKHGGSVPGKMESGLRCGHLS